MFIASLSPNLVSNASRMFRVSRFIFLFFSLKRNYFFGPLLWEFLLRKNLSQIIVFRWSRGWKKNCWKRDEIKKKEFEKCDEKFFIVICSFPHEKLVRKYSEGYSVIDQLEWKIIKKNPRNTHRGEPLSISMSLSRARTKQRKKIKISLYITLES